jgi:hypothetical protein
MIQMTLSLLATDTGASTGTRLICNQSDLVDVSETAQDAGISHKMAVSNELYDLLQRCHPGDPYENEVVLWDILWLAEFEYTLDALVPVFAFTTTIPYMNGENECIRLRYVAGDPVAIEIAH